MREGERGEERRGEEGDWERRETWRERGRYRRRIIGGRGQKGRWKVREKGEKNGVCRCRQF